MNAKTSQRTNKRIVLGPSGGESKDFTALGGFWPSTGQRSVRSQNHKVFELWFVLEQGTKEKYCGWGNSNEVTDDTVSLLACWWRTFSMWQAKAQAQRWRCEMPRIIVGPIKPRNVSGSWSLTFATSLGEFSLFFYSESSQLKDNHYTIFSLRTHTWNPECPW